ncbi:MAG: GNAT family N-acetyltransferase [Candidatus Binatia bacterium]
MHIDEIRDFESFMQLRPVWDDLCQASGATSFFLSHAWFRCCWEGKAAGIRPLVLIVREGSTVVGIAPFFVQTASWRIFPVRTALLMQNQDSPFADVVLAPDRASKVLQALLEHLMESSGAHVVSLNKVMRSSPTHELLARSGAGAQLVRATGGCSPLLLLNGDWESFWAAQSQRFKKTVRNVANRVERLGRVAVEEPSAGATPAECMHVFSSVAARSWKARLPISVGRNARIMQFFEALTSVLHASGRLLLWTLRVDGVAIATEYHVRDGETVYALRSDFDDRYREASPGAYLNDRIIRNYFDRKVQVYDMGPGDNPYKQRWANSVEEFDNFSLFSHGPYALTVYTLEQHAVPHLRQARNWWRGDLSAVTETGRGLHP